MYKRPEIRLRFWGVRGSIPTPSLEHLAFGGNTACLELRARDELYVIDGGTGARKLGLHLQDESPETNLNIKFLLSHFHWDHIQGQYTPEEYESKRGWGHSTWLEATRVAHDCGVKQLILIHHDPGHDDNCLRSIESEARRHFENTDAAEEGWEVCL